MKAACPGSKSRDMEVSCRLGGDCSSLQPEKTLMTAGTERKEGTVTAAGSNWKLVFRLGSSYSGIFGFRNFQRFFPSFFFSCHLKKTPHPSLVIANGF